MEELFVHSGRGILENTASQLGSSHPKPAAPATLRVHHAPPAPASSAVVILQERLAHVVKYVHTPCIALGLCSVQLFV